MRGRDAHALRTNAHCTLTYVYVRAFVRAIEMSHIFGNERKRTKWLKNELPVDAFY